MFEKSDLHMEHGENLSRNAKKKALRIEKIKQKRRENRKLKKEISKHNKKSQELDPNRNSKKFQKLEAISRLKSALEKDDNLKICIDLQFETLMSEKELTHLARQLSRVYGANKKSENPCKLSLANLDKTSKTFQICCDKNDGFANYILDFQEKPIQEVFHEKKSSVIYLTPDSEETLTEISNEKIYVIGGLVDDSVKKHSTLNFAKENGFKTAKLPIEEFCERKKGSFKQILTIDQVFEIILKKHQGLSWSESLKILPLKTGFCST